MLSSLWHLLVRSWAAMITASSTSTFGFFCWIFGGMIAVGIAQTLYSKFTATPEKGDKAGLLAALGRTWKPILLEMLAIGIFTLLVWFSFVVRTVYLDHVALTSQLAILSKKNLTLVEPSSRDATIADLKQRLGNTQTQLESRKQTLHNDDPSFQNMTKTIRAFMTWRQNIGYGTPCKMLITSPDGYDNMYMTFITMAVFGSNCGNGDLNNVGVKPQNIETETAKGMIPGVIVFHALSDAKGANQLETELENLFQVKRSYAIPGDAPPDAIWLQFGTGVKWSTERFAKTQ